MDWVVERLPTILQSKYPAAQGDAQHVTDFVEICADLSTLGLRPALLTLPDSAGYAAQRARASLLRTHLWPEWSAM